jgi:hypothetical protein
VLIVVCAVTFFSGFSLEQNSLLVKAAGSPEAKPMQFYFHWFEIPVYLGGRDQHFVMNTTQFFQSYNNSIYKAVGSPKLVVDFYMYPHLAGPVTFSGTWQVFVWVNGSALKPTEWDIRFFEVTSGGNVTWDSGVISPVVTGGPVGYSGYLSPQILCYNLSTPEPLTHTFSANTTVVVEITINPGADIACELWYDSPTFPSKVIFPSLDYAKPSLIRTYDVNGTERNIFEKYWNESERKVIVRANITDPFGGYDIYLVNITIFDPSGSPVLKNVNMTRISDGTWIFSYSHLYEANWTYPETVLSGMYTVKVSVVDNNGYYHSLAYGVFDPYIEHGYYSFSIGVSYQVNFTTIDTLSRPLAGAIVRVTNYEVLVAEGITDNYGNFSVHLASGTYNVTAYWQGTLVNTTINYEVTSPVNLTIICLVYDVEVEVVDSIGYPLENAKVFITFPNGTVTLLPMYTDIDGRIPLLLTPYGIYNFSVYWQGTIVNKTQVTLDFNGIFTIRCQVYTVVVSLVDSLKKPLANALIVIEAPNGTSNLAVFTDLYGNVTLSRISNGTYGFTIIWQQTPILKVSKYIDANTPIVIECPVYHLTVRVIDSLEKALSGAEVIAQFPTGAKTVYITDDVGRVKLSQIIGGYYNFTVIWKGNPVSSTSSVFVNGNLHYTIQCAVYYVTGRVLDSANRPLSSAEVFVQSPSETKVVELTDSLGQFELIQIAGGTYDFSVFWHGVLVNETSVFVDENLLAFDIFTSVYDLRVEVLDIGNNGIAEAKVVLAGSKFTQVGTTDKNGVVEFIQVPKGYYELSVSYVGQYAFMSWLKSETKTISLDENQTISIQLTYPPEIVELLSSTLPWTILGVLLGVIAFLLIPIIRRKLKNKGFFKNKS